MLGLRRIPMNTRHLLCLLIIIRVSAVPEFAGYSLTDVLTPDFACPENWLKHGHSCYGYVDLLRNFTDAEAWCREHANSSLASIHTKGEACAIANYISSLKFSFFAWIGLHDPEKTRRFQWTDGTRYNLEAWDNNQPDNFDNNEYCTHLRFEKDSDTWNDINCDTQLTFLCKWTPHVKLTEC